MLTRTDNSDNVLAHVSKIVQVAQAGNLTKRFGTEKKRLHKPIIGGRTWRNHAIFLHEQLSTNTSHRANIRNQSASYCRSTSR